MLSGGSRKTCGTLKVKRILESPEREEKDSRTY